MAVPALADHGVLVNRGTALYKLNRHEDALGAFTQAAEKDPGLTLAMQNAANCCRVSAASWPSPGSKGLRRNAKDAAAHRKCASIVINNLPVESIEAEAGRFSKRSAT